jgi:putative hydroxymethylpyrimidine transporter CytX
MATSTSAPIGTHGSPSGRDRPEAPIVLTTDPPRPLRFFDQFAMWANLGISLFGPLTGALIAATTGSLWLGIAAIVVGCTIGAGLLGTSALFGAATGAPAMVSLRGLLGRRGSVAPTVLNIGQNVGWATMEIIVIATAASAILGDQWRWPFVLLAGAVATLMAVKPLGSVRMLRKVMVWLVLIASVVLFVQVLLQPRQPIPQDAVLGFWPAVDLAVAGVVSFAPLAADYSRHSQTRKAAFWGSSLGYGLAAIAYYTLGVLAVAHLGATDVIAALVALPAGAVALGILLTDEVDEAFANIYSTTMSVQNIAPNLDRRIVAVAIGVIAVVTVVSASLAGTVPGY